MKSDWANIKEMSIGELTRHCPRFEENRAAINERNKDKCIPGRRWTASAHERCYYGGLPYNRKGKYINNISSLDEAYIMSRRIALWLDFNLPANENTSIEWEVIIQKTDKEKTCIAVRKNVGFMKNWQDEAISNFLNKHFEVAK